TIAVAQNDIKRILAYSTVSQLGFMMMGLGVGGVAVGMFHLITHAFFKALLFMGAGSVIHGCHEEQDIRCMGGLRKFMPVTFATYAIGMMALCGVPLFFSGFWSKDEILHHAHLWSVSRWPFYLGAFGAFLTAFYMTRQVFHVFFGNCRLELGRTTGSEQHTVAHGGEPASEHPHSELPPQPHESPASMTLPLVILAVFSILLGFIGTPAWPWFQKFLEGQVATMNMSRLAEPEVLHLMLVSSVIVFIGIGLGWWLYGRKSIANANELDVLERVRPDIFHLLRNKYYIDEIYEWAFVGLNKRWAQACAILDDLIVSGLVHLIAYVIVGLSWISKTVDDEVVNKGFDEGCHGVSTGAGWLSRLQDGRVQNYLRVIGVALIVLVLFLLWGCKG
ncbi:MAG TPA: proton-conducting transporter membrane subunit, partial [Candidatus Dormibacteraeota bacterium]|nr:proton-conducting transporter membrane subunit [Candidatus Dormibacteraeota bacterium]